MSRNQIGLNNLQKVDTLPVKSITVGLADSFVESILFKSGTKSDGMELNASFNK